MKGTEIDLHAKQREGDGEREMKKKREKKAKIGSRGQKMKRQKTLTNR